jgi:uncharacterized RDD family membrane protein YckC
VNAGTAATLRVQDKRQRVMITPEGLALPLTIASRGSRAGALMLDIMIIVFGLIVFHMILFGVAGGLMDVVLEDALDAAPTGAVEFLQILLVIFVFMVWYGYFLVQELGPRGATFGKRILGIRIAARNGQRLTPEAVIARNLLRDIEIFYPLVFMLVLSINSAAGEEIGAQLGLATLWFALFILFPFFNRDALRAGDVIAGTWVVDTPRTRLAKALSTEGAARGTSAVTGARYQFGEAELSIYGEHELQTLERMLREAGPEALATVHQTICRKIGWEPGSGDERAFLEAFYAQLRAKLEKDMRFGKRKADKYS